MFDIADLFVMTRSDLEMKEIVDRLMDSLFQVLAAVTGLEASVKVATINADRVQISSHSHHSKTD